MRQGLLRSLIAASLLVMVLLTGWHASSASAAGVPAVDTVQIGPIQAGSGFELYITEQACGSSTNAYFQLEYVTAASPDSSDQLSHTFSGFSASCSIQASAGGAQLKARLPGVLNLDVTIGDMGNALKSPGLPAGCGAPFGPEYPATATGTIDVAVDTATFGRLTKSKANAQIFSGAPQQCPAIQKAAGQELTAVVGAAAINVTAPSHRTPQLEIQIPDPEETANGITDTLGLQISGAPAYASTSANGSAVVGAGAPFTSGSLSFAALPACPGDTAVNGNLSGELTINDPLLGPIELSGPQASLAFTGIGKARPGGCNGVNSQPVEPALLSTCSYSGSGCSLSAGENAVTVYDETDPGTQTITSETVNFGDGSPTVPISNYGAVDHTYAASGTYTVTLTVTDAMGQTSTGTTLVYIDP